MRRCRIALVSRSAEVADPALPWISNSLAISMKSVCGLLYPAQCSNRLSPGPCASFGDWQGHPGKRRRPPSGWRRCVSSQRHFCSCSEIRPRSGIAPRR
jgi:hypothetical protein